MKVVTREVEVCEVVVTVKELTTSEIRAWLSEVKPESEEPQFDLQIEELPLSAMQKIAIVIKEVNNVFFNQYVPALNKLRERLDSVTSEVSNAV